MLTQAERDTLEAMIDRTSLTSVLEGMFDVCGDKAEHIRANWQDEQTAEVWDVAQDIMSSILAHVSRLMGDR